MCTVAQCSPLQQWRGMSTRNEGEDFPDICDAT